MILIADSGSTKTDWFCTGKDQAIKTIGLNPLFVSASKIETTLANSELASMSSNVRQVFFYGAGCSSPALREQVTEGLKASFPQSEINVDHDIMGAAIACTQGAKGNVGILGTGSNFCILGEKQLTHIHPSIGYVAGDEGSGCFLGKRIIRDYIYGMMPPAVKTKFENQFGTWNKDQVNQKLYKEERPNTWLAGFAQLLSKEDCPKYATEILVDAFNQYIETHITPYKDKLQGRTIHFCGSIATLHQDVMRHCLNNFELELGNLVRSPIEGLAQFHQNQA